MSAERYVLVLSSPAIRDKACEAIRRAPEGYRMVLDEPKRSSVQNDRFHAMVRDIARQVQHFGMTLSEHDWKILLCDALDRETRMVPNLDNNGYVQLTGGTAQYGVKKMADLITLTQAYGDQHQVKFKADALLEASYTKQRA